MDDVLKSKIEGLAGQVLELSRDTLLVNLRFLESAALRLELKPCPEQARDCVFACDGESLFYDPQTILKIYKKESTALARALAHALLFCVFGFLKNSDSDNMTLARDVAVESAINSLELKALYFEDQPRQERMRDALSKYCPALTAKKICRYLDKADPEEIGNFRRNFTLFSVRTCDDIKEEIISGWASISSRIKMSTKLPALLENIREADSTSADYEEFLLKLAAKGDGIRLDLDEFDYSVYTFGMEISGGKMPLIEPIEYRDSSRVKDFVIANCASSDLPLKAADEFIAQTGRILSSLETKYTSVRLHVLDTGTKIVEKERLGGWRGARQSRKDLERSDMRPVFKKVDDMIRAREFKNLRGVIILSDIEGIYPKSLPSYQSAFVFIRDDYNVPEVPGWGLRLVLARELYE